MKRTPKVDAAYWTTIIIGSVFGANAGDFLSDALDLGHLSGLPYLAVALALVLLAERFLKVGGALFYWAAIIVIRAAATNIGDAFHDFGIGFPVSIPATAVLLTLVVAVSSARAKRAGSDGRIRADAFYWVAMILVGTLGTVAGDCASYRLHLGNVGAMLAFGVVLAALFTAARGRVATVAGLYWTAVVLIRSAGTAAGDLIAHRYLGLGASTAVTGMAFVALVLTLYESRDRTSRPPMRPRRGNPPQATPAV